ncbi:MAG TPA: FAD-binding and (Fe-S)-binding domain-containing protein [Allosphingosinicella sp.]|nr:FAD-binding and (Fe-S)-binding domain-containing protein [Allosphingosinicella sp.]
MRAANRAPSGRVAAERESVAPEAARALETDLRKALGDAVDFGAAGRALFATDASNYRQVPIGVVTPRNRDEAVETVRLCRAHDVPILPRGGGTSLAGQSCNVAVTIDFSRHLHHLIDLDPEARRARVEPGCILDTLRDAAEEHHLTFGPDPATHDHNTLGGMIGNDSCGVHSVTAGRTADNVERLTVLTYDGALLDLGRTDDAALAHILAGGGRAAEIHRALLALRDRYAPLIEARFPKIPRLVSGFENLDALLPGRDFNTARAVTGTEGSCILILDATLNLVPSPRCKALALLAFDDVFAAADAVPSILAQKPAALEGFDDKSYKALKRIGAPGMDLFPDGKGWLIVEAGGESEDEAERNVRRIADRSGHGGRSRIVSDPAAQKRIWAGREASLGATAFVAGQPAHWPGWEDSAVPPDRLGAYMRDLEALFASHGYTAALYGHFGDGVIHGRVDFDFRDEAGIARYRNFMREAARLVHGYGGSLSGEHGDGQSRAELLGIMYGPELVGAFRQFKSIWDPGNRMNPGKAIEPFPIDSNLRLGPGYRPPRLDTHFGFPGDGGSFAHATIRCVGVGKCRRRQVGEEMMCPSYLATGEERHCTRGRTHLLHEMVRGEVIADGWRSEEVEEALSLCLACKGCKSDCPVGVDVATYKAEFRAHHYQGRLRPRAAYSMGLIQMWARLAEPFPALANLLTRSKLLSPLAKAIAGIDPRASLPPFARQTFRRWFRGRKPAASGEPVLLWPDTFNNHFRPETAIAAVRLLERAGFRVAIPPRPLCCGRPLYDWGFLDRAKRQFESIFACLADDIEAGTPIVGLEPACTAAFRDELPNLFPNRPEAKKLSKQVVYFADFVAANADRFPAPRRGGKALLQVHCHHHAVIGFDAEKALLDRLGLDVERPPQGCCGMAGAYGMARETYEVGRKIGERVLLPRVRQLPPDALILADGFSCREQIERHGGRPTLHIAQLLAERML